MATTTDDIINIVLGLSLIFANIIISVALRHMKQVKRTTIVFLAQLAVSNLVQGVAFMANGMIGAYDAFSEFVCLCWDVISVIPSLSYVTGIFYVYLDLYLSLKKMSIGRPIISTKLAIGMSALSWIVWSAYCSIGFGMQDETFVFDQVQGCSLMVGAVKKEFILILSLCLFVLLFAIVTLHVLTYRLVSASRQQLIQVQKASDPEPKAQVQAISYDNNANANKRQEFKQKSKWVKKNNVVLKTITIIFIMLAISWYPVVITSLIVVYCKSCATVITKEVIYFTYVLVAIQYNSNGVVYLIKIKEFQDAVRNLCCRPRDKRIEPLESSTGRI